MISKRLLAISVIAIVVLVVLLLVPYKANGNRVDLGNTDLLQSEIYLSTGDMIPDDICINGRNGIVIYNSEFTSSGYNLSYMNTDGWVITRLYTANLDGNYSLSHEIILKGGKCIPIY